MAKVVFWSPDKGASGCTHTAIAVSTLLSLSHNINCLLIDANSNDRKISSAFNKYQDLLNKNEFNDSNLGMNAIMRLIKSNKLSPDIIQNYSKPVLKDKLDILYSAIANTTTEERENLLSMPLVAKNADDIYDIVFIDLPKDPTDDSVIRVLSQADIIVCVVPQEVEKLSSVVKKVSGIDEIKEKKIIYVIGNYEQNSKYNLNNIKLTFRIPEPTYVLPHNYIFSDACNYGDADDFMFKNVNATGNDYNGIFMQRTREISEEIIKTLKIKE